MEYDELFGSEILDWYGAPDDSSDSETDRLLIATMDVYESSTNDVQQVPPLSSMTVPNTAQGFSQTHPTVYKTAYRGRYCACMTKGHSGEHTQSHKDTKYYVKIWEE